MDASIYKNIINSDNIIENSKKSTECQLKQEEEQFPVLNELLINRLSKQFTKLLSYKVSQEAYQRYSIRLNVIEILRDWSRIKGNIGKVPIFYDTNMSNDFLVRFLKKYLTLELLSSCDDINNLIFIAEILITIVSKNKSLMNYLTSVIEQIINLKQTEKSEQFLDNVIKKSGDLKLDSSIVEKIYFSQKRRLIEKPFTDCFVSFCSDQDKHEQFTTMDLLFEKVIDSPSLFQLISNQLKDMFVITKYAPESQQFIQNILEKIQVHCDKYNKDTLDLYPTNIQFCVLLLRIKPCHHTENTRKQAVHSLKQIFLKDYNGAMILVSHFPEWLPEYLEFFEDVDQLFQESDTLDL